MGNHRFWNAHKEGPEIYSPSQHRMLQRERVELRSGCEGHSTLRELGGLGMLAKGNRWKRGASY